MYYSGSRRIPVITDHATGERRDRCASPNAPVVDGLGRWPVLDDCEKTHDVDLMV